MWILFRPPARAPRGERQQTFRRVLGPLGMVLLFFLVCVHPLWAQQSSSDSNPFARVNPPRALTVGGKLLFYVKAAYGPGSLLGKAAMSGLAQWRDDPPEWGQGMEGYGRRFASRVGQSTVDNSIRFGVGAALREDPRYFPSERKGVLPRLGHALASTFVTRTDSGGRTFAVSRFAGTLGSAFASNTWHPAGEDDTYHAFGRAGITLALDTGMNVVREFWPDVRRVFHRP
jgi:hypothetical protein